MKDRTSGTEETEGNYETRKEGADRYQGCVVGEHGKRARHKTRKEGKKDLTR